MRPLIEVTEAKHDRDKEQCGPYHANADVFHQAPHRDAPDRAGQVLDLDEEKRAGGDNQEVKERRQIREEELLPVNKKTPRGEDPAQCRDADKNVATLLPG